VSTQPHDVACDCVTCGIERDIENAPREQLTEAPVVAQPSVAALVEKAAALVSAMAEVFDDDEDGEERLMVELEEWAKSCVDKGEAIAAIHRANAAQADYFAHEAARLARHVKRHNRVCERMEALGTSLVLAAEAVDGEGAKVGPLKMRANPPALVGPDDVSKWPFGYLKQTFTPDKAGLKAAIKAGATFPGFSLQSKRTVTGFR